MERVEEQLKRRMKALGMGYRDLAKEAGTSYENVWAVLNKSNTRMAIIQKYVGILGMRFCVKDHHGREVLFRPEIITDGVTNMRNDSCSYEDCRKTLEAVGLSITVEEL